MKYGFSNKQLKEIVSFFREYSEVEEAVLFGSRAIDTYKEASDVDIALKGNNVTASLSAKMKFNIEEDTYLPFFFDFVAYSTITSEELKQHIRNKGVVIYRRMGEWKEVKLNEVIISNNRSIGKDYIYEVIQYLDTGSITQGKIVQLQEFKLSDAPSRAKRLVKNNDIVYSTVRPIQRHYGFIVTPPPNLVVSTGFSVIETDQGKAEPLFIYYYLTSTEIVEILDVIADGSTSAYPSLKPSDIENLGISLPPLPEQKAIAAVLSSLDDKIDLLHRQNKTLEALAEAVWQKMFVEEADPGWKKGKLGNVTSVSTGKGLKRIEYNENGLYPVIGANGEIGRTDKYLTNEKLILTGRVGTLGEISISNKEVWISDNVLIMKPNEERFFYAVYFLLKNIDFENLNVVSTQPLVTQTDLKNIEIEFPSNDVLDYFTTWCESAFNKIEQNVRQISTLSHLRDTLLPKLMSGEVRVSI
ncbi:MAG: restriction endonuclease subunit S [Nitrospirota bacterium]